MNDEALKVAAVPTYGRHGSFFLISLLDSHPEIALIPINFEFYPKWKYFGCDRIRDIDQIISLFFGSTNLKYPLEKKLLSTVGLLGPAKDEIFSIDMSPFRQHILEFMRGKPVHRGNFFVALHYAYVRSQGRPFEPVKVIVNYNHDISHFSDMTEDFPNLRIIHMMRDPRATFHSYLNFNDTNYFSGASAAYFLYELMSTVENAGNFGGFSRLAPKDDNFVLRHEDLHTQGEKMMRHLAAWLGVSFQQSLLESTVGGKIWWGNSGRQKDARGFMPELAQARWKEYLSAHEICMLETLMRPYMERLGYTDFVFKQSRVWTAVCFVPCRKELAGFLYFFRKIKFLVRAGVESSALQTPVDRLIRNVNPRLPKLARILKTAAEDLCRMIFYPVYRTIQIWKLMQIL